MITALTCQVFPRTTDALLMFWTSSSRNAAPRKKKCQCERSQAVTARADSSLRGHRASKQEHQGPRARNTASGCAAFRR